MSDTSTFEYETREAQFGDYLSLLKPRVMSLVVFTAFVGYFVAPTNLHPFEGLVAIIAIAVGAGASGALNMWYDADIDRLMRRTQSRAVPAGKVPAEEALFIGVALSGFAVVFLGLAANWAAAGLLAFTIFFYAVIYTMMLKRKTPQNIVIGGAAGAFPPMVGWMAATGSVSIESVAMFMLIFLWTPPHFWALALFTRADYGNAGVPMLTVTHGPVVTRRQILVYSILLTLCAWGMIALSVTGPLFALSAIVLNGIFLFYAWQVWRRDAATCEGDGFVIEKKLFRWSLLYLFAHFGALAIDQALGLPNVLSWAGVI